MLQWADRDSCFSNVWNLHNMERKVHVSESTRSGGFCGNRTNMMNSPKYGTAFNQRCCLEQEREKLRCSHLIGFLKRHKKTFLKRSLRWRKTGRKELTEMCLPPQTQKNRRRWEEGPGAAFAVTVTGDRGSRSWVEQVVFVHSEAARQKRRTGRADYTSIGRLRSSHACSARTFLMRQGGKWAKLQKFKLSSKRLIRNGAQHSLRETIEW